MTQFEQDYFSAYQKFDLTEAIQRTISGNYDAMNACYECCDRHAIPGRIGLFAETKNNESHCYTFTQLKEESARFANFLKAQGIRKGDVVAGLLPRTHELLIVILGAWRIGAVYQPLFTAFGPKAIEHRLGISQAKLVVTDRDNRAKLHEVESCPAVMTVAEERGLGICQGDFSFWEEMQHQSDECEIVMLYGEEPFLLMFTSGTTGLPKPIEVPVKAVAAFHRYMEDAVGLHATDSFWNVADPGWAYGLYFGITGPLSMGVPILFLDGLFNIDRSIDVIKKYKVTNLAGAPTVYRMVIAGGKNIADRLQGQLRVVSSAGEPLNPEVIRWFDENLGVVINDHYGQTEMGMVLCNHHGLAHPVHIGAAGYSSPGHRMVVLDEETLEELSAGKPGMLAIDREHSPMFWFNGYKDTETKAFKGKYYLTGDTAELNSDGSISFVGRSDDVITTSGYRVGPFDVESALLEHPSVIEAAVVGKPDPERTEIIKAFVILHADYNPSSELADVLRKHVRNRLAAHAYPREIEFVKELPKTPSGKVQRFMLRLQEINKLNEDKPKQAAHA